mgnify:FL=1
MKELDDTWKGILWLTVGIMLSVCLFIVFMEYTFYLKRERDYNYQKESCEAFKKQHPEEEVFYGREVGCKVKRNEYWMSL